MIQHNMQTLKVRKTSFCHFVIFHVALGGYIGGVGVSFIYLYIIYYIYYILYISRPRKIEKMTK